MKGIPHRLIGKYALALVVSVAAVSPSFTNSDTTLERHEQALTVIQNFADSYCKSISLEGTRERYELSGKAKAQLRKLLNLGIEGAAKYQNERYQGLRQEDFLPGVELEQDCRKMIWEDLNPALIGSTPERFGETSPNKQSFRPIEQSTDGGTLSSKPAKKDRAVGEVNRIGTGVDLVWIKLKTRISSSEQLVVHAQGGEVVKVEIAEISGKYATIQFKPGMHVLRVGDLVYVEN